MVTEVDVFTGTGVLVPAGRAVKTPLRHQRRSVNKWQFSGKRHTCCSVWIIGAEYDETEC